MYKNCPVRLCQNSSYAQKRSEGDDAGFAGHVHTDFAVFAYTDEGFDLTDASGNHIENKNGYRCALMVVNGEVVFRL